MRDLIDRQAAIDAVGNMLRRKFGIGGDLAEITIAELPSAQPKRKKGKWIVDNVETEHCSVCKHRFYISALFAVGGNDEPPCCPNCGARMEELDETD